MPATPPLRPHFTERLFLRLKNGESINLVGTPGAGSSRLAGDMLRWGLAEDTTTWVVEMNGYRHNPDGFGLHLHQLVLGGKPADYRPGKFHLSEILQPWINRQQRLIFVFDRFEALLNDPAQRFPKSFFDDLNSIRQDQRHLVSLCCITPQPHLQYHIHYTDERGVLDNSLSWLDLKVVDLPSNLDPTEARTALDHHLADCPAWQQERKPDALTAFVAGHPEPVRVLDELRSDYLHEKPCSPVERIRRVQAKFEYHYTRQSRPSAGERLKGALREWGDIFSKFKP